MRECTWEVATIQIWRQINQLLYETVLQVDDEVGQLAHQDDLQIMMISTKDGIKEKGKAVQILSLIHI